MGEKSVKKRKFILETARKVFLEKGYKAVTMKDIVDACGISRGGLYLYFDSTKTIFQEIMKEESEEADDVFGENIGKDATATEVLALFLKEQKKEIFRKNNNLTMAIYEYYFAEKMPKKENMLKQQFDSAVLILEQLIASGVESGEFYCEDCLGTARNIMFVLEGLKITSQTIGVSQDAVDQEFLYIMKGLASDE